MATGSSGKRERRTVLGVSLWFIPVWIVGVGAMLGLAALIFFGGDAAPRAVVVNDMSHDLRFFYCDNDNCTHGISGSDETLEPGQVATDFWNSSDTVDQVGVTTVPGDRLIGCLTDPHQGEDTTVTYAVLASSVAPCPGQKTGSTPVPVMVNPS